MKEWSERLTSDDEETTNTTEDIAEVDETVPVEDSAADENDSSVPYTEDDEHDIVDVSDVTDVVDAVAATLPIEKEGEMPQLWRRPYYKRSYLLFGGTDVPDGLDLAGTKELLTKLGYGNSSLRQARKGRHTAEQIEQTFVPNRAGSRYCDFCGSELLGTEYHVLSDGRNRCSYCGRTIVKTQDEFVELYRDARRNMEMFFGITIGVPVDIKMVSAKKLHNQIGQVFVPSNGMDGRAIGVAIKNKDGRYYILLENGSPKMQAIKTMVHELTHIWQYTNWNAAEIVTAYGKAHELEIYEGMAKWVEIQYTYLISEYATAKREEIITAAREDAYGIGFCRYMAEYPLVEEAVRLMRTPFTNKKQPI